MTRTPSISTHVLDTGRGEPARGVRVELYREEMLLSTQETDADGRIGDLVQGDLVRPDGENLMVRRRGARESLIRIREHFINELLKSVENL